MKVLIIGFGSIGKRHFEVLMSMSGIKCIDLVTKQIVSGVLSFKSLNDVADIQDYDYFVIASETYKHYEQLQYICSNVVKKKILVEKPLYDKLYELPEHNNLILTAYNLRFHPILERLKKELENEQVYYVNVICGQYLPTWRPTQDYRVSYSADAMKGGGVLRDLSHELDYLTWMFGDITELYSINSKISDLDINSDDIFTAIGLTKNETIINVTLDYISKIPMRRVVVHTKNKTIEADVIKNSITIGERNTPESTTFFDKKDKNYTYKKMHESIINDDLDSVCSFDEGKKIVGIIDSIEFKEL